MRARRGNNASLKHICERKREKERWREREGERERGREGWNQRRKKDTKDDTLMVVISIS
jgi:hypothetical protein